MSADSQQHSPMPYVVKLRVALSDDAAPEVVEWRGYAYSVIEAVMQAMLEHGGKTGGNDERMKVESIMPDIPEYLAFITRAIADKATPRTDNDWRKGTR